MSLKWYLNHRSLKSHWECCIHRIWCIGHRVLVFYTTRSSFISTPILYTYGLHKMQNHIFSIRCLINTPEEIDSIKIDCPFYIAVSKLEFVQTKITWPTRYGQYFNTIYKRVTAGDKQEPGNTALARHSSAR